MVSAAERGTSVFACTARFTVAGPTPYDEPDSEIQLGRPSTVHGQPAPVWSVSATAAPAAGYVDAGALTVAAHEVPAGLRTRTRWFTGSPTYTFPDASTAIPWGPSTPARLVIFPF